MTTGTSFSKHPHDANGRTLIFDRFNGHQPSARRVFRDTRAQKHDTPSGVRDYDLRAIPKEAFQHFFTGRFRAVWKNVILRKREH
ncbi:hypothetical protein TNCV_4735401 [Trichonephila clavipes]|nr:hypothetical protein TNCV_4735401 [Trichonephila clavipes]